MGTDWMVIKYATLYSSGFSRDFGGLLMEWRSQSSRILSIGVRVDAASDH